jgi:hypothetical protein
VREGQAADQGMLQGNIILFGFQQLFVSLMWQHQVLNLFINQGACRNAEETHHSSSASQNIINCGVLKTLLFLCLQALLRVSTKMLKLSKAC